MYDELWSEIADAPGEIFDIPELRDLDVDEKFNVSDYLNSNIDYWWWHSTAKNSLKIMPI